MSDTPQLTDGTFVSSERLEISDAEAWALSQLPDGQRVRLASYEEIRGDVVVTRDGGGHICERHVDPSEYRYEFWIEADE